mmetsp:Transcript_13036/g.37546  ORF Transcript_13036/g.37546 Transcript_13036/m.37546 type:complete len:127 (+) Transcript_13036:3-383(+)
MSQHRQKISQSFSAPSLSDSDHVSACHYTWDTLCLNRKGRRDLLLFHDLQNSFREPTLLKGLNRRWCSMSANFDFKFSSNTGDFVTGENCQASRDDVQILLKGDIINFGMIHGFEFLLFIELCKDL